MAGANFGFAGIVTEKLSEENYEYWKECLKSYFLAQGLWGVVSGDEAEPTDKSSPEYEAWIRKNAMALHAIQISCEKDTMSKLRGNVTAKFEWDLLARKELRQPLPHGICKVEEQVKCKISDYRNLCKAVEEGNLEKTRSFLQENPDAVRTRITLNGDTILHVAVMAEQTSIVEELMESELEADLELTNDMGYTAFSIAAINGYQDMVEAMLKKDPNLVQIKDSHGLIPIVAASFFSSSDMVRYLYTKTPHEMLSPENPDRNGATLLNCLITDEIYDMALDLLQKFPLLAFVEDLHRNYTIRLLAHKRFAFASGNDYVFWKKWIYSCIKVTPVPAVDKLALSDEENAIKSEPQPQTGEVHLRVLHGPFSNLLKWFVPDLISQIYEAKLGHTQVQEILKSIFKQLPYLEKEHIRKIGLDHAIQDAIKNGITEFIDELIESTPEIIWRKDKKGRTIFAHAILQRQEKIFNHVYDLGAKMRIAVIRHDIFGNNFLHLAAKLSPQCRLNCISGEALQMQRDLVWFEEVRSVLPPKYMEDVNENNKTPSELFSEEHEQLMKEGERWMKNTAASCMVVATLIAAMMFTSAFTIPGGHNDKTGKPNLTGHDAFFIFVLSNALSLFSSCTYVLVFLGILTSRYTERDFLISLPTKLIIGLSTLFFSMVTMMACFGATITLLVEEKRRWVSISFIIFSIIPIALYAFFLFPLFVEAVIRTYGRSIFKRQTSKQKVH